MCHRGTAGGLLLVLGVGIVAISLIAPSFITNTIVKQLRYLPGTVLYASWYKPPVRHLYVYVMNVTNAEDVLNGAKPDLDEIGPYIYEEYKANRDVRFTDQRRRMYYQETTSYMYDAEATAKANVDSQLDPDEDQLVVPNVLFHGVLAMCHNPQSSLADVCKLLEYGALIEFGVKPFQVLSANELVFGHVTNFTTFMSQLTQGLVPANFALLRNNTSDGETGYKTGLSNSSEAGEYVMWHNSTSLGIWGSSYANEIRGTSGAHFAPFLDARDVKIVASFVDNLYRTFNLHYDGNVEVRGITARRYVLPRSEMANSTENPKHAMWYSFGPSGLLNLSAAEGGIPIFVSKPHFVDGEAELRENVTIRSSKAKIARHHETTLDVEPITGVTVSAMKSLQTNIHIQPHNGTLAKELGMQHIRQTYFPVFWIQLAVTVSASSAKKFRADIILPYHILTSQYMYVAVGLGGVLTCISGYLIVTFFQRRSKDSDHWQLLAVDTTDNY